MSEFNPNKPYKIKEEKKRSSFDPGKPFNQVEISEEGIKAAKEYSGGMSEFLKQAVGLLDVGGATLRTGIEAAASPDREIVPEIKNLYSGVLDKGPKAFSSGEYLA
jgi:hypothetical protein